MKRSLVLLLLVIVFAGLMGTLIARDPGYVLIAYGEYSLQTSLWILPFLLIIFIVAVSLTVRAAKWFLTGSSSFKHWREERKTRRSHDLTTKGMSLLAVGDYSRAEKYLISGAQNHENPGANYLAAARAADAQANGEQRESLLRLAVEADRKLADAASISTAEMALQRGDWQRCLSALEDVKDNDLVLNLKRKALLELQDWKTLADLMPALRRTGADLSGFEKQVAMTRLTALEITDAERVRIFRKLPEETKRDAQVVIACVQSIQYESVAEELLRRSIKRQWQSSLVLAYGVLGSVTLDRRIRQAESWARKHVDADLYLTLARMYRLKEDFEKAMEYCRKSIDLAPDSAAHELMGTMLADHGDYAGSTDYLKRALMRPS